MNKMITLAFLALAFSSACFAEGSNIEGTWNCNMISEYGEFKFDLTLSSNKTFKNEKDMFGETHVGIGVWSIEGKTLIMKRNIYIKGGKEKASTQEFRREIISNSNSTLEMKHDKAKTMCTKT